MTLKEENIKKLNKEFYFVLSEYSTLVQKFMVLAEQLSNDRAKEFTRQGFVRRLKLLKACIDTIYNICPPDIDRKLTDKELASVTINLHAFYIHTYGIFDNLAFIWVKERQIVKKNGESFKDREIGLMKDHILATFPDDLKKYLKDKSKWFEYLNNFRHSLAHRISPYVPAYQIKPEDEEVYNNLATLSSEALNKLDTEEFNHLTKKMSDLGVFSPFITHSFSEKSEKILFQPQILADWKTIIEISNYFLEAMKMDYKI